MATQYASYAPLIGRILLSSIFLVSGVGKIFNWDGTAAYMASKGMFGVPLFLFLAIIFEVGGGLSLLLGIRVRQGASALLLFVILVTLFFHNFWTYEGPERRIQIIMFLKNLAIMGGVVASHWVRSRPRLASQTSKR